LHCSVEPEEQSECTVSVRLRIRPCISFHRSKQGNLRQTPIFVADFVSLPSSRTMRSHTLGQELDNRQPVLQSSSPRRLNCSEEQQPVEVARMHHGEACSINQTWFQSIFSTHLPLWMSGFPLGLRSLAPRWLHLASVLVVLC